MNYRKAVINISGAIRSLFLLLAIAILPLTARSGNKGRKKKVIIVRLDAIGDFILWLDAAKELRKLYPSERYEITLLGNQAWIPLTGGLPHFDRVWPLERYRYLRNPIYCFKMLRKIYREGFDIAVNPVFSREFQLGDIVVKASRAAERIGSQGNYERIKGWQKKISDRWYTRLIAIQDKPLMELERNAEFVRGLGGKTFLADVPRLQVVGSVPEEFHIKQYYVLFPGASAVAKQWPVTNFRELAGRIYGRTGWTGVICGGPNEESLGKALMQGADIPLQTWIGRTSLSELVAIIAGARIVISNDTSAVHIAAAVCTPSVCIVGGGHFGRFIPYRLEVETCRPLPVPVFNMMNCFGCRWECRHNASDDKAAPCLGSITVDKVWKVTLEILERHNAAKKN